eukprot:4107663-Prymnesium_polylepis.1
MLGEQLGPSTFVGGLLVILACLTSGSEAADELLVRCARATHHATAARSTVCGWARTMWLGTRHVVGTHDPPSRAHAHDQCPAQHDAQPPLCAGCVRGRDDGRATP